MIRPARQFDAVYCSEVIEHVIDPRRFLQTLARLMRARRILLLTTPHIREYRRRGYIRMQAPDHKIYFNNANLRRLLLRVWLCQRAFPVQPVEGHRAHRIQVMIAMVHLLPRHAHLPMPDAHPTRSSAAASARCCRARCSAAAC